MMNPNNSYVMKFGGSCLMGAEDMAGAASIVSRYRNSVVIASAMNGVTQKLIDVCESDSSEKRNSILLSLSQLHKRALSRINDIHLYQEALSELEEGMEGLSKISTSFEGNCTQVKRAHILSFGERFSATILKWYIRDHGANSVAVSADEIMFSLDDDYLNATIDEKNSPEAIRRRVVEHNTRGEVPVITGFYCRSRSGGVALLGRNSSDYTAAMVAYALPTHELVFWKDVPGLMTSDPKVVKNSQVIRVLSYDEAGRYIINGARILHPKVLDLARRKEITIRLRYFREPEARGTLISGAIPSAEIS